MPGEEKCITLHLPQCAFALCNEEGISEVLPGEYTVWLGGSQPDARSILLTGQKPLNILLHQKEKVVISD